MIAALGLLVLAVLAWVLAVAAWFTHIYVCITYSLWGFLIAGAIFFPIGVVHGWGVWLGVW